MGQTVPIRQQFLPQEQKQTEQNSTMIKVWTYSEQAEANNQLQNLEYMKSSQQPCQCKIENIHIEFLRQSRKWKLIAVFQYFSQSLRQHIINRKKEQNYLRFFTEKQLQKILNSVGFYVFKYYNYLCNHTDVFSSIFVVGRQFKACHPQLLPNRCPKSNCDKMQLKQKITDSVMQLMLMQKTVKADYRHKERAQKLYIHSPWLIQLINDLFDGSKEILQLSKRSEFVRKYCNRKQKLSTAKQSQVENVRQSTYSGGQRQFMNDIKADNRFQITSPIHSRSHSVQLETQKSKANKLMNLRVQNRFHLISLENYQKELAQSIGGDHQESILIPNYPLNQSINIGDHIQKRSFPQEEELTPETGSFMILEQIATQQEGRYNQNNRSVHSVLPHIILQQQNENNSQGSRRCLDEKQSHSVIINHQEGSRYDGDLLNGKKHGKGTIVFSNGVYYSGEWRNDMMNGFGTLYYASGRPQYIGQWKNNKFHGRGSYYNENQEYFQGGFNYKDFDELGYRWKSCEGQFIDDMMEGEGILTLSNGQILKAHWRKNLLNGEGTFYTFDNKKIQGLWLDNKLFSYEIESE